MQYLNIDPFRVILMHLYNMYTSWFLGFFLNFSKAYVYIWVQFLKNMHVYIYGQKTSKEGEVGRWWCFWHGPLLLSSWVPYFKTQRLYFHQAGNLKDFLFIMWQLKLKFLMMFNGHQRDRCKKTNMSSTCICACNHGNYLSDLR